MTGYGVASRAMTYYPNANGFTRADGGPIDNSFDGRSVFRYIIYPVYYMMYGQISTELEHLDSMYIRCHSDHTYYMICSKR